MCLFLMWGADVGGLAASLSPNLPFSLFFAAQNGAGDFLILPSVFFPDALFRKLRAIEAGFFGGGRGMKWRWLGFSPFSDLLYLIRAKKG